MATTTVRVSEETHRALVEMAEHDGLTISAKVAALVRLAEEDAMLAGHEAAIDRLRADPEQWAAWQAEVAELDGTLGDGLEGL
ncbi:MAG: hypothetical protein ABSH36_12710 [Solirubrobacteraceae bacterium]|jgi:hypothetical protein